MKSLKNVKEAEAQLEAAISQVLAERFPWLKAAEIQHQIGFEVQLGHGPVPSNGTEAWMKRGKADIIVSRNGQAILLMELKRTDLRLLPADDKQALSYARLLTPMPPFTIVTNGHDTRIFDTLSAQPWTASDVTEEAFTATIKNISEIAAEDKRNAIKTLMGSGTDIWPQAVRLATERVIYELTMTGTNLTRPLSPNFSIPRRATRDLAAKVMGDHKLTLLVGDPLIGKTNVIAQLANALPSGEGVVLLSEQSPTDIPVAVANFLTQTLSWPATGDDARNWLLKISHEDGPRLVLAFDNFDAANDAARTAIEELTSSTFGKNLHLLLCLDKSGATNLVQSNGRNESVLGRRAQRVEVEQLSDREFGAASNALNAKGIGFMPGAQYSAELRQPWLLQAHVGRIGAVPANAVAVIPSLMSIDLISATRQRFTDPELRRCFHALASAVVEDAQNCERTAEEILEFQYRYIVRRSSAENALRPGDVKWLLEHGYVTATIGSDGTPLLSIRVPTLLASELG
jgi:hypothetical protein